MADLTHYLVLSGVLFTIGTMGVFLRRNVITILLSIAVALTNIVMGTLIAWVLVRDSFPGTDERAVRATLKWEPLDRLVFTLKAGFNVSNGGRLSVRNRR